MWPYWIIILLPSVAVFSPWKLDPKSRGVSWAVIAIVFICFVGLRDQTGGDWFSYQESYYRRGAVPFSWLLEDFQDPAYYWPGWLLYRLGASIHYLNLICATVLITGLVRFCRTLRFPWIGFFAAVPYLVIVVGMGYTRQAGAIGVVLFALVELGRGNRLRYALLILVAATFHRTAVFLLPIVALVAAKNRIWTAFWAGIMAALSGWLFIYDSAERMWSNYVVSGYSDAADGAPMRIAMGAVPAVIFLIFRKRLPLSESERRMWTVICILALVLVPVLAISYTAVDRFALYFLPIQVFVWSTITMLGKTAKGRTGIALLIVGYYLLVFFVWANFAGNSYRWFPYHSMLMRAT